jgi:hypothetical protein
MHVVGTHGEPHAEQPSISINRASPVPFGTCTDGPAAQKPGIVPDGGQPPTDQPTTRTPSVVPA